MKIQGWISSALVGLAAVMLSSATLAAQPEAIPGEFVVKLKNTLSIQSFQKGLNIQSLGGTIKNVIPSAHLVIVKRPTIEISSFALKALNQNPNVEYSEPNYIYRISKTPNEPSYVKLWGMNNTAQADSAGQVGTAGIDIGAEKAWDIATGSKDIVVAVIDTGVDYNHPDLKDNMWTNDAELNGKAGVDDDSNGYVDDIHGMSFVSTTAPVADPLDDHGHGSHCSGTIGAKGDDGAGIVGVNWNVRIMPVKFLSADGGGSLEGAVMAIDYATKMHARIMSNSWGGGGFSQALQEAITRANDAGILFIAAAGNDGSDNDETPSYPASYQLPNVLAVAAIDNKGNLASFSNYGRASVQVAAPGVNIYSAVKNGGYDSWSGTSMATPHVSGVAALLASNEPTLTALQLKERVVTTVRPLPSLKGKVSSGGLVNAYNALTNTVAPPDANDPTNWKSLPLAISSAHPYAANSNETFEVTAPGATEVSLYFEKFETERDYDKVTFFDRAGNKLGEMSGTANATYTAIFKTDYVKLVLTSDDSIQKNGFDLTKVSYR